LPLFCVIKLNALRLKANNVKLVAAILSATQMYAKNLIMVSAMYDLWREFVTSAKTIREF